MMKSKKGLSESLLMTLLIGGNVIWGAQRYMQKNRRNLF